MYNATRTPARRQRPKPQRTCKLVCTAGVQVLTLKVGGETDTYFLEEIVAADGRGFSLTRLATTQEPAVVYHVNLYSSSGHHGCGCLGFLHHGHCKHIASLVELDKRGKLPVPKCEAINAA